jgi:hypothetical protein
LSPGPIERLKPYFKPRPRVQAGAVAAPPAAAQSAAPAAQAAPAVAAAPAAPAAAQPPAAAPSPVAVPNADSAGLEARRAQLARRYAELESDLGGLVYEMAIRDSFRLDVVVRRAAELQAVDAQLTSVEQQLGLAVVVLPASTCTACGTPAPAGAGFCGRCGATLRAPAAASIPTPGAPR